MSELAQLTAAPRTDVLEGHTLTPAGLVDYAMVEEELARRHVAVAGLAAVGMPDKISQLMIQAAMDDVAAGRFKYPRPAFNAHAKADTMLPFLLHLVLRRHHKGMTRDQATALINDANFAKVQRAVLELFNYRFAPPEEPAKNEQAAMTSGTGPSSSPPSENAESAGATSAT